MFDGFLRSILYGFEDTNWVGKNRAVDLGGLGGRDKYDSDYTVGKFERAYKNKGKTNSFFNHI